MPHRLAPLSLALILALPPTRATADDFAVLSRNQVVELALSQNPVVVDSRLEWEREKAARGGVAGILADNPTLSAEAGRRRDPGFPNPQASVGARLDQPLDVFGQAGTRRQAADDRVAFAKARFDLARAEIAARALALFVAAQVSESFLALRVEQVALAQSSAEALRTRVRLGASSDIDLRLAEAELERALAAVSEAEWQAGLARLDLREWLNLPATAGAKPGDPLVLPPPPPVTDNLDESVLRKNLAVAAVEKRRLAIDSELDRLKRERLPRIALGVIAERPNKGETYLGLGLTFSPALWRRNQGPIAEAKVEQTRSDMERATTLASLERRLMEAGRVHALRLRELSAIDRAIAHEEAAAELSRVGFEAGKFDFLRVLFARRSVSESKQARLLRWAELWMNVIEMNRLLGKSP